MTIENEKIAWYILDEIAVKHSASHTGSSSGCPICDRAKEAMKLLLKPTHEECRELYDIRVGPGMRNCSSLKALEGY